MFNKIAIEPFDQRIQKDGTSYPDYLAEALVHYCPETGDQRARADFYEAPARALYRHLRHIPATPSSDLHVPTRFEWQILLATEALRAVDTVATQRYKMLSGSLKWHWHRALWHRALSWGMGEFINRCVLHVGHREVNLLTTGLTDSSIALVLEQRDTPLGSCHEGGLEYAFQQRVCVQRYTGNEDMDMLVWMYMQDSYWRANPQANPVTRIMGIALERALGIIKKRFYQDIIGAQLTATPPPTPLQVIPVGGRDAEFKPVASASTSKSSVDLLKQLPVWLQKRELQVNCKGAYLHITPDGYLGITQPLGLEQLSLLCQMSMDAFMHDLQQSAVIIDSGQRYFLRVQKSKTKQKNIPISLLTLDRSRMHVAVQVLLPNADISMQPRTSNVSIPDTVDSEALSATPSVSPSLTNTLMEEFT